MKLRLFILMLLSSLLVQGQDILNEYVRIGIENNLSLKQKLSSYQKSLEALKEARGLFYPDISFNARFSLAEGGRELDLPVGDLLNPVYSTLNALTSSSMFPTIENQKFMFLRPIEQETKIRILQPVFNADIYYNTKIKRELTIFENDDVNQYKRELVAEIKKAYYNAAIADGVLSMLRETRNLLTENIRVNKKLIENNKVTPDYLYRSETELSKFDQELQDAEKNKKNAFAYFNFLLNRSLTDSIIIRQPEIWPSLSGYTADYSKSALENREGAEEALGLQ